MLRVRIAALAAALCVGVGVAAGAAGAAAPAAMAAPGDSVKVNQFMSYDASTKTVSVQLVASFGSVNGGMNFNGGYKGNQSITVPQGWTVKMHFVNKDAIPHSAILLPDKLPLPMQPQDPALPRAYTIDVTAGLPTGGTDFHGFPHRNASDGAGIIDNPGSVDVPASVLDALEARRAARARG